MQKLLIIIGIVFIILGVSWPLLKALRLGQLPGDILIQRPNFTFYFPITTCILISLLVMIILWLINRFL